MASPPKGVEEDAARALLCIPRGGFYPVPAEHATALRTWIGRSDLKHQYAKSSALAYTEDFHNLGGPLLAWGLTRPWNADIQVPKVLDHWYRVLNEQNVFSDSIATNLAYATHLLVELLPKLSERNSLSAAYHWTTSITARSPNHVLWQPNMYSPAVRDRVVAAWADLHTLATFCCADDGLQIWGVSLRLAFDKITINQHQLADILLSSNLTDKVKLHGMLGADPAIWLHPSILNELTQLLARVSPDPAVRIYDLPWATAKTFGDRNERVDFQRCLCETYCPELVPLFSLYPVDWLDRINVFRIASRFTNETETFDIAVLV
jgi:hypothetical protein